MGTHVPRDIVCGLPVCCPHTTWAVIPAATVSGSLAGASLEHEAGNSDVRLGFRTGPAGRVVLILLSGCANSGGMTMENHKSGPSGAEAFYFLKETLRASRKNFLGCCSWMKTLTSPMGFPLSFKGGQRPPLLCSSGLGGSAHWRLVLDFCLSLSLFLSLTFSFNPLGPKYFIKILINNSWQCTNGMYI